VADPIIVSGKVFPHKIIDVGIAEGSFVGLGKPLRGTIFMRVTNPSLK
jgi:transketolase C-terminal domain/subunit